MSTGQPYEERGVLLRIAEGDHVAYRQFFDANYAGLTFFAHSIIGNMTDAEDIVQEAFFRLWMKRQTLHSKGNLRSFLYTMIRNACFDYIRRLQTRSARQEEIQYLAMQDKHFLEATVLYEELLQLLVKEIDALPEKYRAVVTLIFIEGLSYAEISNRLNLPEATVRKQKERALRLLNQAILSRNDLPSWVVVAHLIFLAEFVTKA